MELTEQQAFVVRNLYLAALVPLATMTVFHLIGRLPRWVMAVPSRFRPIAMGPDGARIQLAHILVLWEIRQPRSCVIRDIPRQGVGNSEVRTA